MTDLFSLPPGGGFDDVRGRGFLTRTSLTDAWAWIDAHAPHPLDAVTAPVAPGLAGRVLAADVVAGAPVPPRPLAACDGIAVAADDTLGAGGYNPVPLMRALPVSAGDPLPPWADAVLPYEGVERLGPLVSALMPVPPGEGVEPAGAWAAAGAVVLPAGRVPRPADLGLLAALGRAAVAVVRRPRVRVVLAGGPRGAGAEVLGTLLPPLVARDGGVAAVCGPLPVDGPNLGAALAAPGADVVLVTGRSGVGPDDAAPAALAAAGRVDHHGIALRPGGSAGLGVVDGVPVILLPGEPGACLATYDVLGSRLVRRLAGLPWDAPYGVARAVTARKLVSEIGFADLYRVRRDGDGRLVPVASAAVGGLAAQAAADGAVLIAADSEGIPADTMVRWWCYGGADAMVHPDLGEGDSP